MFFSILLFSMVFLVVTQSGYLSIENVQNTHSNEIESSNMSLRDFNYILGYYRYYGEWKIRNSSQSQAFSSFLHDEGFIFVEDPDKYPENYYNYWCLSLNIYDGSWIDQNYAKLTLDIPANKSYFNAENSTIAFQSAFHVQVGNNFSPTKDISCIGNISIFFLDKSSKPLREYRSSDDIAIQMMVSSESCNFEFTTTQMYTSDRTFQYQLPAYIILMNLMIIFECYCCNKFAEKLSRNYHLVMRASSSSLWAINTFDLCLAFTHIGFVLSTSAFAAVVGIALLVLTIKFEPKVLTSILKPLVGENQTVNQSKIYAYVWLMTLALLLFVNLYHNVMATPFVLIYSLFLIPQIIHNFRVNKRQVFEWHYILGLGLIKIPIVVYLRAYPINIFRLSPNYGLVIFTVILLALQLIVLWIQKTYPRFYKMSNIPRYSVGSQSDIAPDDFCPICMEQFLELKTEVSFANKESALLNKKIIQTPCKHYFHEACLREWIMKKLECPSCRRSIPYLEPDEDL